MRTQYAVAALAAAGIAASASADIVNVDAKAAIFDAGRDAPLLDGILPPTLDIPDGAFSMNVTEVIGLVRAHPVLQWGGPDGNYTTANDTDIDSYMGVSGLEHGGTLPLLAVFLTDDEPENPAPDRLNFHSIGTEFASLSPLLRQSFHVGDGWGDGSLQEFMIPEGATRVFFGFADAGYFTGDPSIGGGAYDDNDGAFMADVQFNVVPAPGAFALLGMGGVLALRRKR